MTQIVDERRNFVFATVLLAFVAGCTKSNSPENPAEAAAVAAITKLGGKVEFEGEGKDRRVFKVYLHNTSVKDVDLAVLETLPKMKNLFLGKTQIGDAGLAQIQKFTELQTLSLNSTRVTDAGLKSLANLTKLKTLNLQETDVTPDALAELRKALPGARIAK